MVWKVHNLNLQYVLKGSEYSGSCGVDVSDLECLSYFEMEISAFSAAGIYFKIF